MDVNRGDRLFTFAVISDSHVNEAESSSVSPYESNRMANARLRYVVAALNHQKPALTLHLGDMINPLPELAACESAVSRFKAIVGELESPLYLTAGNHCIGDKPAGWVPVPRVTESYWLQWQTWFGRQFYAFVHGSCRFVVLSSLLINSETPAEREQKQWLEEELSQARGEGQRIFVMMHYPLFVAGPGEPGGYDNVDKPGRAWLLDLFDRHRVEAAFSGHVHNFFYNRYRSTDMYTVPATSFVRQDYGDLYSVAPGDGEGGRNDTAKLGYFLVDVYNDGHVLCHVRTYGRQLDQGERLLMPVSVPAVHGGCGRELPFGIEVRENWLKRRSLPTNNSVSPFTRRWARNDWPLAVLGEMGVSRLRVFLHTLADGDVSERLVALKALGYEHTVYSYGLPEKWEVDLVAEHAGLLAGWELIVGRDRIGDLLAGRGSAPAALGMPPSMPCYLSEVGDVSRARVDDANVRHVANYGFQIADREHIAQVLESEGIRECLRGLVFRLRRRGESRLEVWPAVHEVSRLGYRNGMRHQVHILFSGNVTAEHFDDDLPTANRVAEAAFAAAAAGNVDVWYDTFEDSDRGYFVRHGLVDRRYNPRLAARVLGHLGAAIDRYGLGPSEESRVDELSDVRSIAVCLADRFVALVLPGAPSTLEAITPPAASTARSLTLLDLDSGEPSEIRVEPDGERLVFAQGVSVASPHWIVGDVG